MSERTLIRNGQVYEHGGDVHRPRVADVLVEDSRIVEVGPQLVAPDATVVDASGKLLVPGLINSHYHSHDTLCRGMFEEQTLETWLLYTLPMGAGRSQEEIRARTLVGALECLRSGITTVQDMLGLVPLTEESVDVVLSAYREVGIRSVFSPMVWDIPPVAMVRHRDTLPEDVQEMLGTRAQPAKEQLDFLRAQLDRRPAAGAHHWAVAPFAPQRCTPELLEGCAELSAERGLPVFTHVYETRGQVLIARELFGQHGGSLVTFLRDVGLLNPLLNIVHSVWISRGEIDQMAAADAGIVLNFLSNLKLKSGVAPVLDMREAGVRLALGCDNCSGTDVQNLFQAMKLFCLFAAVSDPEPGPPLAHEALRHATLGGARAVGLGDRIGAIEQGREADIVFVDLDDVAYLPYNSAARQLVYTETGRGVESVMVAGRMILDHGTVTTVDEQALREEVAGLMRHFVDDYEQVVKSRERALPYMAEAQRRVWSQDIGIDRFLQRTRT
ncbi:amidohydrolase family protein [Blastococcus brunescens]|uniref:Amidohydrolase family protein n=1 Tax=Blastococcus brunescens TaxID=1564165 RepID=A0ABZ1B1F5_9ACTN|nr:amidohydrolase family protein [Blastococcus sp. BMG 8361]WRL63578.1 amidohydrolase family protein [Blastococcus sp. BMG 8361]